MQSSETHQTISSNHQLCVFTSFSEGPIPSGALKMTYSVPFEGVFWSISTTIALTLAYRLQISSAQLQTQAKQNERLKRETRNEEKHKGRRDALLLRDRFALRGDDCEGLVIDDFNNDQRSDGRQPQHDEHTEQFAA